jgi:hypothetical protein
MTQSRVDLLFRPGLVTGLNAPYQLRETGLIENEKNVPYFGRYAWEWVPVVRNVKVRFDIPKTTSRFALALWLQLQK